MRNFQDALQSDTEMFARFHQGMLNKGVYLSASQFAPGFICAAMNEELIEGTLERAREVLLEISTYGK